MKEWILQHVTAIFKYLQNHFLSHLLERISELIPKTYIACYAWALLPNTHIFCFEPVILNCPHLFLALVDGMRSKKSGSGARID